MKKILYPRLCSFCTREMPGGTSKDDLYDSDIKLDLYRRYSTMNDDMRGIELDIYFKNIDKEIHKLVEDGFYGKDKALSHKIYVSVLLSLLNSLTLTNNGLKKLNTYKNISYYKNSSGEIQPLARYGYENFIQSLLQEDAKNSIILFDLNEKYSEYVMFLTQKIKIDIVKMLCNINDNGDYPEDLLEELLVNATLDANVED